MAQSKDCPKCGGGMAKGFIVDNTHGGSGVSGWVEGEPARSIWTGLKLRGRTKLELRTWRCRRCGYLESYAE